MKGVPKSLSDNMTSSLLHLPDGLAAEVLEHEPGEDGDEKEVEPEVPVKVTTDSDKSKVMYLEFLSAKRPLQITLSAFVPSVVNICTYGS